MNEITKKNGYRETELGSLPKEWEVFKLKEVADYINGYPFKPEQWKLTGLPIIRIQNLTNNTDKINYFNGKLDSKYKVSNGDLLISWSASLGVFIWKGKNAWLNQHIFKVQNFNSKTDKIFLYYSIMTKIEEMKTKTHGSTMHHITKKDFINTKIPLPPFNEQKKIAGVLSAVQDAIEKTEAVIQATKDLKKSMMKHLFTYGPVPLSEKENVRLKETEIGMIPEEWELKKYKDIANINERNVNPKKDFPDKLFEYIDINSIDNSINKITETKRIFGINAPSRARRLVRTNDVIISTVRPYLRSFAIVSKSYNEEVCSTGFSVLTSKATILPQYLFYVSISDIVIDQFKKQMRGANYPAINITNVRNTLIPLPNTPEQKQVSELLYSVDKKIQAEENKKKALEDLFNSLLHNLMTAKIRVNDLDLEGVEI